ncbi:MAG: phosphoribosyltransferase family protein [Thaumarchaeota archaeon]|nr:phosphoribosyltransferase family protein [Nitrososphaerota archaeon]
MESEAVRLYAGERFHRAELAGLERDLPIVEIGPGMWIASDAGLILGDVEFLSRSALLLSERVKRFDPEVVLTAEAKSIALAYELSRLLGHDRFVVARKTLKAYMGDHISQEVKSITTRSVQQLLLTREEAGYISGRRVCLLDDVVSTGSTLRALEATAGKAGGDVVCRAAVWREGPWYDQTDLICLGLLPVYVSDTNELWRLARGQQGAKEGRS